MADLLLCCALCKTKEGFDGPPVTADDAYESAQVAAKGTVRRAKKIAAEARWRFLDETTGSPVNESVCDRCAGLLHQLARFPFPASAYKWRPHLAGFEHGDVVVVLRAEGVYGKEVSRLIVAGKDERSITSACLALAERFDCSSTVICRARPISPDLLAHVLRTHDRDCVVVPRVALTMDDVIAQRIVDGIGLVVGDDDTSALLWHVRGLVEQAMEKTSLVDRATHVYDGVDRMIFRRQVHLYQVYQRLFEVIAEALSMRPITPLCGGTCRTSMFGDPIS